MINFDIFIKIILGYTQDIIIESNTSNNADMVDKNVTNANMESNNLLKLDTVSSVLKKKKKKKILFQSLENCNHYPYSN